jgi:hypothetical protein
MSSMSTPIANLPKADSSSPPPPIDASVTDVLEEMEREVSAAQQQQHSAPQQPPQHPGGYMPQMPMVQQMGPLSLYVDNQDEWVDMPKVKTAVLATLMALLLLIPKFPDIYDKFARIAFLEPYELYVRAGLLALVLYILMVRLDL